MKVGDVNYSGFDNVRGLRPAFFRCDQHRLNKARYGDGGHSRRSNEPTPLGLAEQGRPPQKLLQVALAVGVASAAPGKGEPDVSSRTVFTSAGVALLAFALVAPFTFGLTIPGGILLAFSSFAVGAALIVYGQTRHGGRRRYRGRR